MTITWVHGSGPTTTTICHGTERGAGKATGPYAEQQSHVVNPQIVNRIRTEQPSIYDRQNKLQVYQFSVVEQYATLLAAQQAYHTRRDALGREGKLVIDLDGTNGIEYRDAFLEVTPPQVIGVSLRWTYKITSPNVVSTP